MVCGLLEAQKSGKGQVIDAAMVDGSAALMSMFFTFKNMGMFIEDRQQNIFDGAAHFYDTYETKDNKYISVGSVEPQFYALLLEKLGLDKKEFDNQLDRTKWPERKEKFAAVFKQKTRDEWCELLEGTDACFAPVLSMSEAIEHPHNKARNTFLKIDGVLQAAPTPRFNRTVCEFRCNARRPGQDTVTILTDELGMSESDIADLKGKGVVS